MKPTKRRWKRVTQVLAAASLAVLSTLYGVAIAQPRPTESGPPRGEGYGPGRRPPSFDDVLERHAERLGLDDKTRTEIRGIAEAAREESRSAEERLRGLHAEMRTLLDQPSPALDAVLQQADRIGAAETAMHKLRLRTMLRIRALLTPEQRAELVRIHEERQREHGGPPPDGPPPPGPPPPGPPPEAF
jgi:Spy/CpxP family protein refolding chaperone